MESKYQQSGIYKCQFPYCNYSTKVRTQIHSHHITPREQGGSNKKINRIYLCPNHHSKIYIPTASRGMHAKRSKDSLILLGWKSSTSGLMLHYIENNEEKFL